MTAERKLAAALIALFLAAYILTLGQRPLFMPDETRYAEVPREMRESGDWVSPRLLGMRYFEKPVLTYWLVAASESVFGENNFAVRLPGALAAGCGLLLAYWLVRRSGGSRRQALLSAGILMTCLEFYGVGVYIVTDMILAVLLTAGLACFYVAWGEPDRFKRLLWLALFGAACGLAFLTKGFLALAVPCAVIGPFVFWQQFPEGIWPALRTGQWRQILGAAAASAGRLLKLAVVPLIVAVAVALPWSIMIHLREPDFWHYFFWTEHVERALAKNADHAAPFWFYAPYLLGGALPWAVFFPAAAIGTKGAALRDGFTRFLICWAVFPLLLFSCSSGKMVTYILPCFPPLAILTAFGLLRYFESGGRKAFDVGAAVLAVVFLAAGVGVIAWQVVGVKPIIFSPGEEWKLVLGCGALAAWVACAAFAVQARDGFRKILLAMAAPAGLFLAAAFVFPHEIEASRAPQELLTRNRGNIPAGARVFSRARLAHACAWYLKRCDVTLFDNVGELEYGVKNSPVPADRRVSVETFAEMVSGAPSQETFVLAIEKRRYDAIRSQLPAPASVDRGGANLVVFFKGGGAVRPAKPGTLESSPGGAIDGPREAR